MAAGDRCNEHPPTPEEAGCLGQAQTQLGEMLDGTIGEERAAAPVPEWKPASIGLHHTPDQLLGFGQGCGIDVDANGLPLSEDEPIDLAIATPQIQDGRGQQGVIA